MSSDSIATAREVAAALRALLEGSPELREPMNALVVWTELGRGLAGTLGRKGADEGLLGRLIATWCEEEGAPPSLKLEEWLTAIPVEQRLSPRALTAALQAAETAIVDRVGPLIVAEGSDGPRAAFTAVVRGWFTVGVELVRALPRARRSSRPEQLGVLAAWCARYLPRDASGPADLGVRVQK